MKRFFCLCLAVLIILTATVATASAAIPCTCLKRKCVCFIQLGDEGPFVASVIKLLKKQGYCSKDDQVSIFDQSVESAVMAFQREHHLPETGMLDDETLTLIIFGVLPNELSLMDPLSRADFNWIPTDGGRKRHAKPTCSGIIDPRKVSIRNANALGYDACKKCNSANSVIEVILDIVTD